MKRHYRDLGSASDWLKESSYVARPIKRTTQIWVVRRHQYGSSAFVSQTSFRGETSGGVAICLLFFQASYFQSSMKNNDNSLLLNDTFVNFNLSINVMMDLIMFTIKNLCDTI